MLTLQGIGTQTGIGDGPLYIYISPDQTPQPVAVDDPAAEARRAAAALDKARQDLTALHAQALANGVSEADAEPFDVEQGLLADADFTEAVQNAVLQHGLCAEYAVYSTGRAFSTQLRALDDPWLRQRGHQMREAADRVLQILRGDTQDVLKDVTARVVLAADLLQPAQTMRLDRSKVCAFVMREGGPSSHCAILMRALGIPTVTGLGEDFAKLENGRRTMVDGTAGLVVQEPDTQTMSELAGRMFAQVRAERSQQMLRGTPAITQNGVHITLSANIALPAQAKDAIAQDADGIGLFRSELLYLRRDRYADEETLYEAYREALLMMGGRRVVVRTLDAGCSKDQLCPEHVREANPALGERSVPLALRRPYLLMPQLRALLRASAYGNLAVVLPMVVRADEIRAVKERMDEARAQLKREGRMMAAHVPVGAMVETPAAAVTADLLCAEAEFLCIGTNDLTQYVLVADRRSPAAAAVYDQKDPAVLRLVSQAVHAAHAARVPVSVCGECASDPALAGFFAALAVDELSMAPVAILPMKQAIRRQTAESCRTALRAALGLAKD